MEEERKDVLAKCVFPHAFDTIKEAVPLSLCFLKSAKAFQTESFWLPYLQKDYDYLKELITIPHYSHLLNIIKQQYQLIPKVLVNAGGISAVIKSKINRRLGSLLESKLYIEETWSNETKDICISYRVSGVQICIREQLENALQITNEWIWPNEKIHYFGDIQHNNGLRINNIRGPKGCIHFQNGAIFDGTFSQCKEENCSRGIGTLLNNEKVITNVECLPFEEEWGDLLLKTKDGLCFIARQADGRLVAYH